MPLRAAQNRRSNGNKMDSDSFCDFESVHSGNRLITGPPTQQAVSPSVKAWPLWLPSGKVSACRFEPGFPCGDRLVCLIVKASASRAENPVFESRLLRDFSGSSHTSDLKTGTPVATLPGAWLYRVSAGTGRFGVSIM